MQPNPKVYDHVHPPRPVRHLCETCIHAEGCSLRADATAPVHTCEEYDDGPTAAPPPQLVSVPEPDHAALSASDRRQLGLCANCELREECTLPRAPGGVWFCEEYQ